jgi:hypothetical protein
MVLSRSAPSVTTGSAPRLRRPSWRDHRLLIGLLLLLTSITLGARTVALADRTEPFYAARATLSTGTPLTADSLQIVRLRITGTQARYLDAREPLPAGRVLLRTVGAGELVPLSATAPADQLGVRPVTIPIDGSPPAGLSVGGLVDLWASSKRADSTAGGYLEPQRVVDRVEVFHVDPPATGLSAGRGAGVQVLLPVADLPVVLDALANDARIVLLPVPGSVPRSSGDGS